MTAPETRTSSGGPQEGVLRSGASVAMNDTVRSQVVRLQGRAVTAVELADIAGVEANTVRKIAKELLDMLERDLQRRLAEGDDPSQ